MARRAAVTVRLPLTVPGQRIGVMGGSFNPPHEGHLIVARTALRRLRLDQLWWLVTPGNPLKGHDDLAPLEQRMAACRTLAGSDPRMTVTAFEADLDTPYTARTLKFLQRRCPGVDFVWVMGADNLASFHRWKNWRHIAATMAIAVVDRPGWRFKALSSPAAKALGVRQVSEGTAAGLLDRHSPRWLFLTSKLSALSSSDLRKRS